MALRFPFHVSTSMQRHSFILRLAPLLLVASSGTVMAEGVQWPVSSAGNGHFYEAFAVAGGINWTDASALAAAKGGYLATLTSAAENQFVFSLVDSAIYWQGSGDFRTGPWLGGFQAPGSPEPAGGWQWLNGEGPFGYINWQPGEPNNNPGGTVPEDKLAFWAVGSPTGRSGNWNDLNASALVPGYIVEFDTAPLPVPEPASALLSILGLMSLGGLLMKRQRSAI
jgi:hypothetical protein